MVNKLSSSSELINIIASNGCIQLLQPFLYKPKIEMYQSEIIKETGVPQTRALKLLKLLTERGILEEKIKAGSKFYSTRVDQPVLKQLKVLIIVSKLYELTREFSEENIEVYLFGSAARGDDTEYSDIDLLVIGNADKRTVSRLVDKIKGSMSREVNPVVYTYIEYSNLYNKERVFYESIEKDKVWVL
jgi:predicted nucleotidyltransferase